MDDAIHLYKPYDGKKHGLHNSGCPPCLSSSFILSKIVFILDPWGLVKLSKLVYILTSQVGLGLCWGYRELRCLIDTRPQALTGLMCPGRSPSPIDGDAVCVIGPQFLEQLMFFQLHLTCSHASLMTLSFLYPFSIPLLCYFLIAVAKHHGKGNLQKRKHFTGFMVSGG